MTANAGTRFIELCGLRLHSLVSRAPSPSDAFRPKDGNVNRLSVCLAALPLLMAATSLASQSRAPHALDPLSGAEITQAVAALRQSGHLTPQTRFGTITVQPRSKSVAQPRAARIVGFDWTRNEGFVAVVDLDCDKVESWTVVDSEPPMRLLTIRRAEEIAHADPRWVAALKSRGIDTARVSVLVGLPERAKLPRHGTDRVVTGGVFLRDAVPNALSVDGLILQINLTQGRLESFADVAGGQRTADSAATSALSSPRAPLAPLTIQTSGSSVKIDRQRDSWDRWRLRVGIDPRRGLEVHEVTFDDAGRRRSILYSGSVSEIIAPYGDPTFSTWYPRDEGDYGMGIYSQSSAVPLNDVPANAVFLPSTMHDHLGRPVVVPRAIAIYERDGGILWRHANISRRARQLVVSGHSTIDNYDYQFNWIFSQDGAIEGEVVLSGIMNVNGPPHDRHGACRGARVVRPSRRAGGQRAESSALLQLPIGPRRGWRGEYRVSVDTHASPAGQSQGRAVRDERTSALDRT